MTLASRLLTAFVFTLLLVLGDLWFRAELLSLDTGKYALAILSLLVLLWFCRELVDWSGIRIIRFFSPGGDFGIVVRQHLWQPVFLLRRL